MTTLELANHVYTVHQAFLPLLLGLIAGAAQAVGNTQKEAGSRRLAAATAQFSPWTKMTPNAVQSANPVGDIASGAMAGLQYQQQNPSKDSYNNPDTLIEGDPSSTNAGLIGSSGTTGGAAAGALMGQPQVDGSSQTPTLIPHPSLNPLQKGRRADLMFNPYGGNNRNG